MGICSQLLELIKDNQRSRNVHLKRAYRGAAGTEPTESLHVD